jgi:hypothetical protein
MTDDEKEQEAEKRLTELFDRSAGALSDSDRAKFLRRASDVGRVVRRRPPGAAYVWIPALAAAAAVVYLVVPKQHTEPVTPARSAPSAPLVREDSPAASNVATEQAEAPNLEDLVDSVFAGDPSELEPLDLGPLMVEAERAQSPDRERGNAGSASPVESAERSMQ